MNSESKMTMSDFFTAMFRRDQYSSLRSEDGDEGDKSDGHTPSPPRRPSGLGCQVVTFLFALSIGIVAGIRIGSRPQSVSMGLLGKEVEFWSEGQ